MSELEEFDQKLIGKYTMAAWGYKQGEMVSLMIHLGHRLGLYKAMDGADADAIEAFIELYGEEELGNFEDAYQGEMTGAEFAEQLVTDCYCMDIPSFVCVDWEATWQQLEYDYDEQDGHIFSRNW